MTKQNKLLQFIGVSIAFLLVLSVFSVTINTLPSQLHVNSKSVITNIFPAQFNPNVISITEVVPVGPYSFDPAIDYESVGMEIIANVYETLIQYNGSSTHQSQMIPLVASAVPTITNGGISANYLNYTFHIRSGLKFANGDPLTAWDAYISFVRTLLFVTDSPGTPGWILAQDLLPSGGFAPIATSYQNITSAITVNNTTQTVTFRLLKPDPSFLYYIADPEGASIMDYSWIVAHGAGITFTSAGFAAYMNQGNVANYNTYIEYNAMGSGPYMIKNYIIGQSVALAPNPYYTPVPGVLGYGHAVTYIIGIQWEKIPSTALLIAESGQTDIVTGLPTSDYPSMAQLQSQGKINITTFPTLTISYFTFNFNINTTMLSSIGAGYSVPQYYFTNLDLRRAFAYAFNYTNYIENLVGNAKYGADFAFHYTGAIPEGMSGYMNSTQLQQRGANVPTYNLTIARQYLEESGLYNTTINIPLIVYAGDTVDFAAAADWSATLNSIDPHIQATPIYMQFSQIEEYMAVNRNPMPIYLFYRAPDFPYPSDYIIPMYQENGTFCVGNGWNPQTLLAANQTNQSIEDALMNQYIADAQNTGNSTLALKYYDQAEVLGVNLTFYTYTEQTNGFCFYSRAIYGVQFEQNPIYSGHGDTIYIYLSNRNYTKLYQVTFTESGLSSGTLWAATLSGTALNGQNINVTLASTKTTIIFNEPDGSYTYKIHIPSEYQGMNLTGSINIIGSGITISIKASNPTISLLIGIIAIVVVILAVIAVILIMRRGKK